MNKKFHAFTITEVIVVTVLIALLAAISLPGYQKSVVKSHERAGVANLLSIRSGVELYRVNSGVATIPNWNNLNAINTALGLRLADNVMTYRCWGTTGGKTNLCRATHPDGWNIEFNDQDSGGLIHCRLNNCPSCPAANGNCE